MRYILIFLLIATIVMVFVFADHFPSILARYPMLQEANWAAREWLGMDTPRGPRLSEGHLKETEKILRKEVSRKKEEREPQLPEYHDSSR